MGTIGLVVTGLDEGARLLNALDEAAVQIEAAFWLLTGEYSDWRLVLATPIADDRGSHEASVQVIEVLRSLDDVDYLMDKVTIVGLNDRRVRDLRNALSRGLPKSGYCLGRYYSRDMEVLDSYVYRVVLPEVATKNEDKVHGTVPKSHASRNGVTAKRKATAKSGG